ncbi:MAG TPA: hypothetical protein VKV36_08025 [Acidimicrobiales bacterium]|nr:hypothetical protein [Acidimicrobiales bacterium]
MTAARQQLEAEYRALRHGVGAYFLDRDAVVVRGPDAIGYLQGQCSQDVAALPVGSHADALLLAPDGKLDALVRVTRTAPEEAVVDTDGGFGEQVVARLVRFRLRTRVDIELLDWSCLALRGAGVGRPGPTGPAVPEPSGGGEAGGVVLELGVDWNGFGGVDLLGPPAGLQVPEGAVRCSREAWDACRVESGVPVMGAELDHRTIAAEAGLVERCVSFTKGCYTGQELVARLDARGSRVARRLCAVVPDPVPPSLEPDELAGAELRAPGADKQLGMVTTAAWCPGVGAVAGLAYAHRSLAAPGPAELALGGSRARIPAVLRPLPLV